MTTKDEEFIEKVRSVGFVKGYKKGKTTKKPVVNELDGSIGGHHVEHYDGSVDAQVSLKPVGVRSRTQGRDST